ncbi:hypothetical protein [Pikeienuella sp. HZG-20]|uniref:hypothetical protein n=1 Tax=Paludibacillus litoralis TaxID=3133267 RepID=UPI0030EC8EEB
MKDRFSEDEVITTVERLTRSQLVRFIEVEFVKPQKEGGGYVFRRIDIARLELLCDLSEDFEMDETALEVVISLIDQLHGARRDLLAMARAIDALPPDLRTRVEAALRAS